MNTSNYTGFGYIRHDLADVEQLFQIYLALHFIYPRKLEWLLPVIETVKHNWTKAMRAGFPLFGASIAGENSRNILGTTVSWQYLNRGGLAQHLSANHPVGTRMIFLEMLQRVINQQHLGNLESYQIYYRPDNKYPNRLFESVTKAAGERLSQIFRYAYLQVPFLAEYPNVRNKMVEITNYSYPGFIDFLSLQRSDLFVRVQELDTSDLNLDQLDQQFRSHGLTRRRQVFAALSAGGQSICGVIIVNQSSLGLNFSFFENSAELILDNDLSEQEQLDIAGQLLSIATIFAGSSAIGYLPLFIDPLHFPILEKLGGQLINHYNLFIILRGGYETWYNCVDQATRAVFERFIHHSHEQHSTT